MNIQNTHRFGDEEADFGDIRIRFTESGGYITLYGRHTELSIGEFVGDDEYELQDHWIKVDPDIDDQDDFNNIEFVITSEMVEEVRKWFTDRNTEEALDEFNDIASSTEGASGAKYNSSNGYEFVIWIDNGDEPPTPASGLIKCTVDRDDGTYEGMYKFSMTLPQ